MNLASAPKLDDNTEIVMEMKDFKCVLPEIIESPEFVRLYPEILKIDKKDIETNVRLNYLLSIFNEIEKDKKHHDKYYKKNGNIEKCLVFSEYMVTLTDSGLLLVSSIGTPILLPITCTLSLCCNFLNIGLRSLNKYFNGKKNKHKEISTISNTIINTISKQFIESLRDNKISGEEFDNIMQIKENYEKLKKDVEQKTGKIVNSVELNKQVEELLMQKGKTQYKKELLDKIK